MIDVENNERDGLPLFLLSDEIGLDHEIADGTAAELKGVTNREMRRFVLVRVAENTSAIFGRHQGSAFLSQRSSQKPYEVSVQSGGSRRKEAVRLAVRRREVNRTKHRQETHHKAASPSFSAKAGIEIALTTSRSAFAVEPLAEKAGTTVAAASLGSALKADVIFRAVHFIGDEVIGNTSSVWISI